MSEPRSKPVRITSDLRDTLVHVAVLVRAALASSPPAGDTTTETVVDYRVVEVAPESRIKSDWYEDLDRAHRKAHDWDRLGYEHLLIETRSRSVSTTRTESPWEEEQ